MSQERHPSAETVDDPSVMVRTYAVTHPANLGLPPRRFTDWDQLVHASRGVMDVSTDAGLWVVPPHRAVWIPAGTIHGVELSGRVSLRTVFFRRPIARAMAPGPCRAINVSALLRELILHTCRLNTLHSDRPAHVRLMGVLLDQLQTSRTEPLQLPLPTDPRARRVADELSAEPGAANAIGLAQRRAGASRRTLERLFAAETQLTLGQWHRRARLISALRLLARGDSVTTVALDVGYRSPSAFISAFRAELGTTPGRYFNT